MKKGLISIIVTIMMTITALFTGCSVNTETKDKPALGIVCGAHKFNPSFKVSQKLSDKILEVSKNDGNVSVTVSSGTAKTVANWSLDIEKKDVGETKLNQIAKANTEVIIQEISSLKADNPEVNTLSAIIMEANNLQETKANSKTLIIYDTGLCTAGMMNFATDNLLNSSPDYIASQLEACHSLPNLNGVDVFWFGLGQTRGEQVLDDENRYKLKEIWNEVLNRSHPKSLTFNDSELTSESDENLPDVTIVNTISTKINAENYSETPTVVVLEENQVSFIPDTAEFSDIDLASKKISALAETFKYSNETIYVIGSTASFGDVVSSKTLSKKRAETVSQLLINYGVDKDKLFSIGIGMENCSLRVKDLDDSGNLVEEQAIHNRAVFLVPQSSSVFAKLVDEGVI